MGNKAWFVECSITEILRVVIEVIGPRIGEGKLRVF
jgi:hypothetical protein